ncbi:hypothetical protein E3V39_00410 [Gammaproteobacteria bacterium LSUCC0112]|nr:hypothetical protein E3V39_00410 [Gammaproteobacteria bacterium LSUCC0112]
MGKFITFRSFVSAMGLLLCVTPLQAELSGIDIRTRTLLSEPENPVRYELITGVLHFTLDPRHPGNQKIVDIQHAPLNSQGHTEFSADFKLLVPRGETQSTSLLYHVNNRGGSRLPPEVSLSHPLAMQGHTFLATGWINEMPPADGRLRLFAPVLTYNGNPLTGSVRYEIIPASHGNDLNIAGSFHLAYAPVAAALPDATLSVRPRQDAERQMIARDQFSLTIADVADSNQPLITLNLEGGMQAGHIYELMYDAQDPVLSGAGLAGIRDVVSALRHAVTDELPAQINTVMTELSLPPINATVAWGYSQSGRLLRQFLYQGFNEDLDGRQVFDGVVPLIAGAGFGMFNQRFAMPTRTNGQHENHLFPNDFFPFTYGDSTDPFSGRTDGILKKARESGTEPKLMHIQTSNEYWLRGGSLPHTDPLGLSDAEIPDNVRFYTIGGSPHSSGTGTPGPASSGQLPANPNLWTPIAESLLSAMVVWVNEGELPPASVYPSISRGTLLMSHLGDSANDINPAVWRIVPGINHPRTLYQVAYADFGPGFLTNGIAQLPDLNSKQKYGTRVPATGTDNNDLATDLILPPLTAVPLATFVPWNLRAVASGADTELATLSGGYLPLPLTEQAARDAGDPRPAIGSLYRDFADYLQQYESATDALIARGFLLPAFKPVLMDLAQSQQTLFDRLP